MRNDMLDLHTHILPEMDDGSKSVRESVTMLRIEKKQGVDRVVLTPHFYADRESLESFLLRREQAVHRLEEATAQRNLPMWYLGAEVAFFNGMSHVDGIEQLCIGGTRAMLIEMPFCKWSQSVFKEVDYLREHRGIQPIVAHAERYLRYQPIGTIRDLSESGMWIQVNASFFLRWQTAWLAQRMLKRREIQFLGSDCHNIKSRSPNMDDAIFEIDRRLGKRALKYMGHMEQRLLEGGGYEEF